jgi:hypothetical protein
VDNFKASQEALDFLKRYLKSDEFALYYLGIIQTEINAHGTNKICQDSL